MSCEHLREDLSAFLDGELAPRDRRRIADHLSVCADCRAALRAMEEIAGALQRPPQVPEDLLSTAAILSRIPDVEIKMERLVNRFAWQQAGTAIVGIGVTIGLGFALWPVSLLHRIFASLLGLADGVLLGGITRVAWGRLLGIELLVASALALLLNSLLVLMAGRHRA